jgi:hypothetical protein
MHLAYQQLLQDHPDLAERIADMPLRVFSGKADPSTSPGTGPSPDARAVFFCYRLPAKDATTGEWDDQAGYTRWYLYDVASGEVQDDATRIYDRIKCEPDTPRETGTARETLTEIRRKMDKHIKNTYERKVQAPVGVKSTLLAWMELV